MLRDGIGLEEVGETLGRVQSEVRFKSDIWGAGREGVHGLLFQIMGFGEGFLNFYLFLANIYYSL